jgi:hypothetical protein
MNSLGCTETHVETGHFDGCAGGAEHFSVGLNGNGWLIDTIRDRLADHAQYVAVNGGRIGRWFTVARSAGTKEGFEGG